MIEGCILSTAEGLNYLIFSLFIFLSLLIIAKEIPLLAAAGGLLMIYFSFYFYSCSYIIGISISMMSILLMVSASYWGFNHGKIYSS